MTLHWLALGDSYTICTGASSVDARWPEAVARELSQTDHVVEVTNLGVDGWTTVQIIDHAAPRLTARAWDIVTACAGVNDEYQGVPLDEYRERIERLHALIAARTARAVVGISIPDYSYTPVGRAAKPMDKTVVRLRAFNDVAEASARAHGFTWIDLFDLSRSRMNDPAWVGPDGLHPSDEQYAAWAEHIAANMRDAL